MANFPSILNTFTRPATTNKLNSPSHSGLHNTVSSALGQVEAFLGVVGASSVVGTLSYDVRSPASGGGGHVQFVNKGGTGQITYSKGDILVAQSSSVLTKLAIGVDTTTLIADSSQSVGIRWGSSGKFGGTGADGALAITSGATNIDLGNAAVVIKNYTSISITGTASLTFTNPHANGTIIILKSQGNVTLTSSATPMIVASSLGASGGSGGDKASGGDTTGTDGNTGSDGKSVISFYKTNAGGGKTGGNTQTPGTAGAIASFDVLQFTSQILAKYPNVIPGAGGGGAGADKSAGTGSAIAGDGGRGGGSLIIECAGAFNFTTSAGISVAGANGDNASATAGDSLTVFSGGGGGGGAGICLIFYNSLTANSGTITVSGGTGGNTSNTGEANSAAGGGGGGSAFAVGVAGTSAGNNSQSGGNGGAGTSLVAANTEFV